MLTLTIEQVQGGVTKTVERYSQHVPRQGERVKADDGKGTAVDGDVIRIQHDFTAQPPFILITLMTLTKRSMSAT